MEKDLQVQLNKKVHELRELEILLNNFIGLKNQILITVSDSEHRLTDALQQNPQDTQQISLLRKTVEDKQLRYNRCQNDIGRYQADIARTQNQIERLETELSAVSRQSSRARIF